MDINVTDAPERQRYEARLDGELAGFLDYEPRDWGRVLVHTEVFPDFENRGVGGVLVRYALDDTRHRGSHIRPVCSFVKSWLERHPDYGDVVREERPSGD